MCHRIGRPPISIIGLGLRCVSSEMRVPKPPANKTHFMPWPLQIRPWPLQQGPVLR